MNGNIEVEKLHIFYQVQYKITDVLGRLLSNIIRFAASFHKRFQHRTHFAACYSKNIVMLKLNFVRLLVPC